MNRPVQPVALGRAVPVTPDAAPFRSHAQSLEDVSLWRALRDVRAGRYIDIGAYDPWRDNVSAGFAARGWSGVSVDPLPGLAEAYAEARPDTEFMSVAVSDRPGPVTLSRIAETGRSFVGETGADTVSVRAVTLADLFAHMGADAPVHWLKIDVEGHEAAVLRSWGRNPARPWILCVEHEADAVPAWEAELTSRGYDFVRWDGLNRFYLHESQGHRFDALALAPRHSDTFLVTEHSGLSQVPAILHSLRSERDSLVALAERLDFAVGEARYAIKAGNDAQESLHADIARLNGELERARRESSVREQRLRRRFGVAERAHDAALSELARHVKAEVGDAATLREDRDNAWDAIARLDRELGHMTLVAQGLSEREAHLEDEIARHRADLERLRHSTSWRVTAPLRAGLHGARALRGRLRPRSWASALTYRLKSVALDTAIVHWRRDYKLLRPLRMFVLRRPALGRRLSMRPDHWDDSYLEVDPFDPDPEKTASVLALQRARDPDPRRYRGPDRNARPRPQLFAPLADTNRLTRAIRAKQRRERRR